MAFKSLLDPSWEGLGPSWGRSWSQKSLNFVYFIRVPWTSCFWSTCGFEVHLGQILGRFWRQKGSQKAPKSELRWSQNEFEKRSKYKIGFGSLLRRGSTGRHSNSAASRSRGGGRGRHKSLPLGTWIRIWLGFVALGWVYTPWGIRRLISLGGFIFQYDFLKIRGLG